MAGKGTSTTNGATKVKRERKSPAEAQAAVVNRVRKITARATAQLQAAQIRSSGRPGGNPELIKAFEQFDAALENIGRQFKPAQG